MKITSDKETIATTPERLYNVLVNFLNIEQIPEIPQVSNWTKLDDGCSFTIMNMITCAMRLTDQQPFSRVGYTISTDKGMEAQAKGIIQETGAGCSIQIEIDADVPVFMQPMIKGPLTQAINKGLTKIKELAERS